LEYPVLSVKKLKKSWQVFGSTKKEAMVAWMGEFAASVEAVWKEKKMISVIVSETEKGG